MQVPSMEYKVTYNMSERKSSVEPSGSKWETPLNQEDEDMVCSVPRGAAVLIDEIGLTPLSEH